MLQKKFAEAEPHLQAVSRAHPEDIATHLALGICLAGQKKYLAAQSEFQSAQQLAQAADIMAAHPIALQLRNLQVLTEIASDKNSTIVFPAQFMDTVSSVQAFMKKETK